MGWIAKQVGAVLCAAGLAGMAQAQDPSALYGPFSRPPVVVELFTSQGCSACPPADALLADLADRSDVFPLAFHVDYWDYLGWADEFARPEFTARQRGYAAAQQDHSLYTPQFLVNGYEVVSHQKPAEMVQSIERQRKAAAPLLAAVTRDGEAWVIQVTPRAALAGPVHVLLVRYLPERRVTVESGENRGQQLVYRNVVAGIEDISAWDGAAALRLRVSPGAGREGDFPADTRHALLLQQMLRAPHPLPGPIIAAIRLD